MDILVNTLSQARFGGAVRPEPLNSYPISTLQGLRWRLNLKQF